jgi:hypothetical protein
MPRFLLRTKTSATVAVGDLQDREMVLDNTTGELCVRDNGGTLRRYGTGGGGSAITVQDEGSNLTTTLSSLNFTGAGVTATNSGGAVTVNVPSGGASDWASIAGKPTVFPPDVHTHPSTAITDFTEAVQDVVGAFLVAGTNVTLNYNDVANTLTINASGGGGNNNMARKAAYFYRGM